MPSTAALLAARLRRATKAALKCAASSGARHRCNGPSSHYQPAEDAAISNAQSITKPNRPNTPQIICRYPDGSALAITNTQITPPTCAVLRNPSKHKHSQDLKTSQATTAAPEDPTLTSNTRKAYAQAWKNFAHWCNAHQSNPKSADTSLIQRYLTHLASQHYAPATLRLYRAALKSALDALGRQDDNPANHIQVKKHLRSILTANSQRQKQANPLDQTALEAIRATAHRPRTLPSGKREPPDSAARRARLDIAIASIMREAMLRISEASALTWGDVAFQKDGTARLLVRRSKTDQESQGAILYLGPQATQDLLNIQLNQRPADPVFPLTPARIAARLAQAAKHAGVVNPITGHSPRIGMAQDLAATGAELPALMTAGRWKNPGMPARYIENIAADRGAVAQYHRKLQEE